MYPGPYGMQPQGASGGTLIGSGDVRQIPHTECPITPQPAADWRGRELRVEWCLANLTAGEKAYLFRLLYEAEHLRIDRCKDVERKERQALDKAAKKEVWP